MATAPLTQGSLVLRASAALMAAVSAILVVLSSLGAIHWSDSQKLAGTALIFASVTLACAVIAHFWPSTGPEPVAVGVAIYGEVNALLIAGTTFGWFALTTGQMGDILAAVNPILALVVFVVVRGGVSPVTTVKANLLAAVQHAQSIALRKPSTPMAPQVPMPGSGQ